MLCEDKTQQSHSRVVVFGFDGTVHSQEYGCTRIDDIPGTPVEGVRDLFRRLSACGYEIVISTFRATRLDGYKAVIEWLTRNGLVQYVNRVTSSMPIARCYVGSRSIGFDGDTSKLFDMIANFTSWTE